jgi:glycosyltransferase involved in cell wall biosynthesis
MAALEHVGDFVPARPAPVPLLRSLSAFFPAHDEEANVVPLTQAFLAVLPAVAERWELIIVNDGSRDRTPALADQLAREHPGVRVVHHPVNRGYGAAVRSGLAACRYDYVFFTDGDRQFDPAQIGTLIAQLGRADVVVGYRHARADPLPRRLNAAGWNLLMRTLLRIPVRDVNCAFKLFHRDALAGIDARADGAMLSAELMARIARRGHRIAEVPVEHLPRRAGTPTGARPGVILRAFVELFRLYRELRPRALTKNVT